MMLRAANNLSDGYREVFLRDVMLRAAKWVLGSLERMLRAANKLWEPVGYLSWDVRNDGRRIRLRTADKLCELLLNVE